MDLHIFIISYTSLLSIILTYNFLLHKFSKVPDPAFLKKVSLLALIVTVCSVSSAILYLRELQLLQIFDDYSRQFFLIHDTLYSWYPYIIGDSLLFSFLLFLKRFSSNKVAAILGGLSIVSVTSLLIATLLI